MVFLSLQVDAAKLTFLSTAAENKAGGTIENPMTLSVTDQDGVRSSEGITACQNTSVRYRTGCQSPH